jgi:hypothetical protein
MVKTKAAKSKKAAPAARFTVNKDNTITDNKTGLLIIQDPTLLGEAFKQTMTFAAAEQAIAELNKKGYAGFKDWRLPTVEELVGMTDRTKHDPCYDTAIFKGRFDDWYWSREICAWSKTSAWCVFSYYGNVDFFGKVFRSYVRPVRSSQCRFDPLPVR